MSFWRLRTCLRSPACAALKISAVAAVPGFPGRASRWRPSRPGSRFRSPQVRARRRPQHRSRSPSGPAPRRLTCPGGYAFDRLRFVKGPPGSRQLPFGPGTKTCMRRVIQRDRFAGPGHMRLLSCCLSAAAVGFSSRPVPPRDSACCLPVGGHSRRTVTRFPRSAPITASGAGRPLHPGSWCSPGGILDSGQHCRIPAADLLPRKASIAGAWRHEAYRVHLIYLPDFPSPVAGGWITGPWNPPGASHPAVQSSAAHAGSRDWR